MNKLTILTILACFTLAFVSSSQALRWPDNASYRVSTMGGAVLAIEDETTALNAFNHQNPAGTAFIKKENRIDGGINYKLNTVKIEGTGGTSESTITTIELARPGGEYRGLTYWLDDQLFIKAGIEGSMITAKDLFTPTTGNEVEDVLNLSGIGGGAGIGYKVNDSFAVAAGFSYVGVGGKPADLDGAYNVLGGIGGTTEKLEISASILSWGVGAVHQMSGLGGEDNSLTFGVHVGVDDDMPVVAGGITNLNLGDYSAVIDIEGDIPAFGGAFSQKTTQSQMPIAIGADAIFTMGSMLEAGLLFDYIMADMNVKDETTTTAGTTELDYKESSKTELVISPVVQVNIPVGEDMAILPGVSFHNYGSSNVENFSLDLSTSDENDTFKSSELATSASLISLGVGMQAMAKAIQLGLQYETGSFKTTTTSYASPTASGVESDTEGSRSNFRFGAEFWAMPMLALRAGYAILATTVKDGAFENGSLVDYITTTNRLTFGAGLKSENGMTVDLLVQMDTNVADPKSDPEPEDTGLGILLGFKIPL